MTDIYMLSLSTENHYGVFSNYRMFVCPSEIINIIMKYAQYILSCCEQNIDKRKT
jgi:hypothetical protein